MTAEPLRRDVIVRRSEHRDKQSLEAVQGTLDADGNFTVTKNASEWIYVLSGPDALVVTFDTGISFPVLFYPFSQQISFDKVTFSGGDEDDAVAAYIGKGLPPPNAAYVPGGGGVFGGGGGHF